MQLTMRLCLKSALVLAAPALIAVPAWGEETSAAPGTMPGWTWPPYIIIPLVLVGMFYVIGIMRMRRGGRNQVPQVPVLWFAAGWFSLLIALDSPIHELGEQLFWVHMTEHEILMLVSAPLLVLGRPLIPFLWALPERWRYSVGLVSRSRPWKRAWGKLSSPLCAWVVFAVALWIWHAPVLFSATLHSEWVHAAQHISFLGAALLFWWALMGEHGGKLGYGGAVIYLFTTGLHTTILGALITFAPTVWYRPYIATAPAWGLTALQDQQYGGLIMWVPAGVELLIVALVLLLKLLKESDRRWEYTRTAELLRATPTAGAGGQE